VLHFGACPGFRDANGSQKVSGESVVIASRECVIREVWDVVKGRRSFGVMASLPG